MADNTGGNSGRAVWQIDRFELVFYNPRHRRWQYFVEDPLVPTSDQASDESLHRRQIRSLLKTFHEVLECLLKEPQSSFRLRQPSDNGEKPVIIPSPRFEDSAVCWPVYLDYLLTTAASEGLPKRDGDNMRDFVKNSDAYPEADQPIQRTTALAILSLLPILEHWDTWGCLLRAYKRSYRDQESAFPPALPQNWSTPIYLVDLEFPDDTATSGLFESRRILGYPVAIQGAACNHDLQGSRIIQTRSSDFFGSGYCYIPVQGPELQLYRCYANLVDPIQKQLAGSLPKRQFVAVYPIPTEGRVHFLQLAFSTVNTVNTSMADLWQQWLPTHTQIWTPQMRSMLRSQLQRVQILAFQTEARAELTKAFLNSIPIDDKTLKATIHKAIYHLFPVEYLRTKDGAFRHDPYEYYADPSGHRLNVGSQWVGGPDCKAPPTVESVIRPLRNLELGLSVAHEDNLSMLLASHEAREILDEQFEHLQLLQHSLPEEKRRKEENRQRCARIIYKWLTSLPPNRKEEILTGNHLTELLNEEIHVPGLPLPSGYPEWKFKLRPESFERYLTQAFEESSPEAQLSMIKRILKPSLLLQLSEYSETGPVKLITHTFHTREEWEKCFLGSGEAVVASARSKYRDLDREIKQRLSPLRQHFPQHEWLRSYHGCTILDFHQKYTLPLTDRVFDPGHISTPEAANCRESLMVPSFLLGGVKWELRVGDRFWGLCPGCLLRDFMEAYRSEERRGAHRGQYFQQTSPQHPKRHETPILYESTYHRGGQHKVRLVQQYFWFPYKIDDLQAAAAGHLCASWLDVGIEIGDLYYYCHDSSCANWLTKKPDATSGLFMKDEEMTELIQQHLDPQQSMLIIKLEHWKMDEKPEEVGE